MKAVLMFGCDKYEVWLCEVRDGTLKPAMGTFPLSVPREWVDAINADRDREELAHYQNMSHM